MIWVEEDTHPVTEANSLRPTRLLNQAPGAPNRAPVKLIKMSVQQLQVSHQQQLLATLTNSAQPCNASTAKRAQILYGQRLKLFITLA